MTCLAMVLGVLLLTGCVVKGALAAEIRPLDSPKILSAAEIDYPPFSIVGQDGRATGFSVELMRAALAAMDRGVTFRTGPWEEVRGWLEKGEIEALPLVGRTPEREQIFDFTVPYMSLHGVIVVREGTSGIRDLSDLEGKQVAVLKGDNAEEFLRREDRGIDIVTTDSFETALTALSAGRHDAVVIQRLVALRLIRETGLTNLQVLNRPIEGFRQEFCFAVREGDRETLALLNEGLALVMADGTYRHLHAKWFAALQLPTTRRLVIGGDHNFPPFEYLDETGQPAGFNVELTRAIAREMGLDIEIRLGPWTRILRALEGGEIDAIQGMFYSPERDLILDFTQSHMVSHYVAVVRRGSGSPPENIEALAGRQVVVQEGDIAHDYLAENAAGLRIAVVDAQEDALAAIAEGQYDVAFVARLTALYWIEKNGWNHLMVGHKPLLSPEYSYAALRHQKALLAQFGEGLEVLEQSGEYRRIREKWMGVYGDEAPSVRQALRTLALVLVPLLAVFLLVVLWSWSLRRQVARRTRALQESENRFRRAVEDAPFPIMMHADDGEVLTISRAWESITGYRGEEISTVADWISRAYDERGDAMQTFNSETYAFQERKSEGASDIVCKDGTRRVWEFSSTPLGKLPDGRRLVISMAADVTAHKQAEDRLRHLTHVLRAIRKVNQIIIHERQRDVLLQRACDMLTETRGYHSAWVGLRDREGNLKAVAGSGIGEAFATISDALGHGDLPACCRQALEGSDLAVVHNMEKNCIVCSLSNQSEGTAALAGALRSAGREFGVLVVVLAAEVADDPEEQTLFKELTDDIAFALQGIEVAQAHQQVQTALAASEAQYRLLADNTLDVIWTMSPDLAFSYVNPAVAQLTGHTPGEWIGSRLSDHCDAARLMEMAAIIEAEIAKGDDHRGVVFETEMRRRDGEPIPVEIHGKLIFDDEANPVMLQGVTRDITERKKAEADLVRSEHRLRSLVNAIPDLVWLKDQDGVYILCNPTFERFFGARESDIVGKTDHDFVDRELADSFREYDRKAMAAGGPSVNEEALTFAGDGYRGLFETVKTPMYGVDGDLIGVLGIARDISARKKAEEERLDLETQLHQAQKMESVGRLAGGVAHDFNNILSVVMGYAELALDEVDPTAPLHDDLKEIISAARRSRDITRQLLAFARKETIAPEVLDLNETVENLLKMLRRLIGEDIDLAWHPAPELWPVKLDPSQVDQILANLCINARDAIRDVGKVTIETKRVTMDADYCADHAGFFPGDFVMLAVSDDGMGMDRETVDRIFEPFYTTKGIGRGTGLGLSTVYGIVKQNEGFINVYSEPGSGTSFRIYLPRHLGEAAGERGAVSDEVLRGRGETVLVVEDDAAILNLTMRILTSLNYRVLDARTPAEAIALAKSHAQAEGIQLLITDVVMPDMNGRELSDTLTSLDPGLKTLFMSGYTADIIAHRGVLDADVHFIHKPFSRQDLALRVRQTLEA